MNYCISSMLSAVLILPCVVSCSSSRKHEFPQDFVRTDVTHIGMGGVGGSGGAGGGNFSETNPRVECSSDGSCKCLSGFAGPHCEDVDECLLSDVCAEHGACLNTFGSYVCFCDTGFEFNGTKCIDINECNSGVCGTSAICGNTEGGFDCQCAQGYFGSGDHCSKVDQCAVNTCGDGECLSGSERRCICNAGRAGSADCASTCDHLAVGDTELAAAIEDVFSKPLDTIFPASDLDGAYYLEVAKKKVKSLSGLECWPHLRELRIFDANLESKTAFGSLVALNDLRVLSLECSGISSLLALKNHPHLQALTIDHRNCPREIDHLEAIGTIPTLRFLHLRGIELGDVSWIKNLSHLQELDLTGSTFTKFATSLGSIAIESLFLSDTKGISSLESGTRLEQIRNLDVSRTDLPSFQFFEAFPNVQFVSARGNNIKTVDVAKVSKTYVLDLAENQLQNVSSLSSSENLRFANLNDNAIDEVSPALLKLGAGTEISMIRNPINCSTAMDIVQSAEESGVQIRTDCPSN